MSDSLAATPAAASLAAPRTRTGGPSDDRREKLLQELLGWTLLVLLAVLVTRLGLM